MLCGNSTVGSNRFGFWVRLLIIGGGSSSGWLSVASISILFDICWVCSIWFISFSMSVSMTCVDCSYVLLISVCVSISLGSVDPRYPLGLFRASSCMYLFTAMIPCTNLPFLDLFSISAPSAFAICVISVGINPSVCIVILIIFFFRSFLT